MKNDAVYGEKIFYSEGKYGIVSYYGVVLIDAKYDRITLSHGVYVLENGGKYGIAKWCGEDRLDIKIEAIFDDISFESGGIYACRFSGDDECGVWLDRDSGKVYRSCIYLSNLCDFSALRFIEGKKYRDVIKKRGRDLFINLPPDKECCVLCKLPAYEFDLDVFLCEMYPDDDDDYIFDSYFLVICGREGYIYTQSYERLSNLYHNLNTEIENAIKLFSDKNITFSYTGEGINNYL